MLLTLRAHEAATIDDFERPNSPAPWTFYNGAEFPGAAGSLSSGLGRSGKGARLAFDFTNGGNYVSADYNLPSPLSGSVVSFWVRNAGSCKISLRLRDSTNQTFQYDLARPTHATDPAAWYQHIVDLGTPTLIFGGDGSQRGALVWLSILANNLGVSGIEGGLADAIDFDDVKLIETVSSHLDPFATVLVPPPSGKSDLMSGLGVHINFPNYPAYTLDTQALDAIKSAGFSWIRKDLFWSDVERTPGVYDFSLFDGLVRELDARGLKALFILDYSNELHSDCPPGNSQVDCFSYGPQSEMTIKAFGDYAEAVARHYAGRGVRFEIWNEPNHPMFWRPVPNATHYAALTKETIARVHSGDPNAQVSTASLSGFDFKFLRAVLDLGAAVGTDAIGVHPYRQNAPESATDEYVHMRSIVSQALSPTVPIWDTEWGYSSQWYGGDGTAPAARHRQAVMVLRKLLSAQLIGFPLSIYYDVRDDGLDPNEPEHHFGLIRNDYSDKPAIIAVRTLKAAAANRTWVGSLQTGSDSLHALRLDGPSDAVIVAWLDGPGGTLDITLPLSATATDMFGAPVPVSSANGRSTVSLREADGPVYITVPFPASKLLNIATRLRVQTGENVLIDGFIITGTEPKKVLIRAIGPSLASFFNGILDDPVLELFQGSTLLEANDNWKNGDRPAIEATGIPPSNDLESAIVRTLSPGTYTAIVRGKTGPGIGLVEAYDLNQTANSKLANISTRGFVDSGNDVMIGGFIVGGSGGGGATVVVRAIGPTLGNFGIAGSLQDPTLDLVDANGVILRANNDWKDSQQSEIEATGLPPSDNRESAVVQTVAPGNYTAIIRGFGSTTGISLVEVYNVP